MNKVDELQTTVLKGILFDYYSSIGNLSAYDNVNKRLKWYLEKVNKAVLEEGYKIRENQLRMVEQFQKDMIND